MENANLSEVDARNADFTNTEGAKFDENVKEQILKLI
ncbi:hypothetical protein CN354_12655 [Bacillus cereus]|nr:hypothetical protein CN354_12655 [Bacillus cereus]